MITGKRIKMLEQLKALEKEIKMFEQERIEDDLTNTDKLKYLYGLYYKLKKRVDEDVT